MPNKGFIFDFDGLIVDTETAIYDAWSELYEDHGERLELEVYVKCVGSDFGTFSPESLLEERLGRPVDWPPAWEKKDKRIRETLSAQDSRPGVRKVIGELGEAGRPLAVASSSSRDWVEGWLGKLGLLPHFAATRCRDDVERVKPDPALFQKAAEALELDPADCLVFEDSENGLKAARAAGIGTVVIVHNPVTGVGKFTGADLVLDSWSGFRPGDFLA
jgi:putative hydrolase of the HAD superfamily